MLYQKKKICGAVGKGGIYSPMVFFMVSLIYDVVLSLHEAKRFLRQLLATYGID